MSPPFARDWRVSKDMAALADALALWLLGAADAVDETFSLCLSGGSTPKALYERLAQTDLAEQFPWERTHLFFGDERFVPPTDPRSNFAMVHEALISKVPIPAGNVHPVATEGVSLEQSAQAYERELQSFYGSGALEPGRPLFDVTLLGLGEDGHTASLFPGSPALAEVERWCLGVSGEKAEDRVTLTYPVLQSSASCAFMVAGEGKAKILSRLAHDPSLPAARLQPEGALLVFADAAAAGKAAS
jgi:6-phosphogluconolactonase